MELISLNLRFPLIQDTTVLQVIGAGLMYLFDKHKTLGTDIDDTLMIDQAKLTMGDHCSDLIITDEQFELCYNHACDGLNTALVCHCDSLKALAEQIDGVRDIFSMEYPGVLKLYVKEGVPNYGADGSPFIHLLQ